MNERKGETVERHPDSGTLAAFREHRLAGAAVVEIALHVGRCGQCARVEAAAVKRALDAMAEPQHLSDAELDVLVDGREDDPSHAASRRHVATCAMCRAEVDDLRRFDAREQPSRPRWWIAAAIAFVILAIGAIALRFQRPAPDAPLVATRASAPRTAPAPAPAPRVVASLADGNQQIALLENGTISGVQPRNARDAEDARAVLSGKAIAIPTFIAAMPGTVRGGGARTHPLRAIEPFRSAVASARPRFSWTPVEGARGYRVAVFDADYEEIARSETLQTTSWTPSKALPAGVDLSWHVVADTGAGELSSAGTGRAEALFRVLEADAAVEVQAGEEHYRDSHLLRGLLYSRHGLLHDAQREFRQLAEQNPGSPIPRTLLQAVSR